jgi:hypothetical protein
VKVEWRRLYGHPAVAGLIAAVGVFVGVATVVAAVRQDGWEPIWLAAWLPAVLVASLARTDTTRCRRGPRRRAQR